VARSLRAIDASQCDEVRDCDTIREAKEYAQRVLTDEHQRLCEYSEPMNVAIVKAFDGTANVCLAEYIRPGYREL